VPQSASSATPIQTVLAEKITTAITLGAANTRVRDYADIYTLITTHDLQHTKVREALVATGAFRGTSLQPLSTAIDDLAELRHTTYTAYRTSLRTDGEHLPASFSTVVDTVVAFADHLIAAQPSATTWHAHDQSWHP
jgi:hypothetical protein